MCARDKPPARVMYVIRSSLGSRAGSGAQRLTPHRDLCGVPGRRWGEGRSLRDPPGGGGERGLAARSVFEGPVPQLPWEVSSGARGLPACPLPSGFWGFKTR